MQCQHARELFSDYLGKSMESALTIPFENHLQSCAVCREEMEGIRAVWAMLDSAPLAEPPPFFHENVMSRLDLAQREAEEATARKRAIWDWRALLRPRSLAFAGAAAVLLLSFVEVTRYQNATSASLNPLGGLLPASRPAPHPSVSIIGTPVWGPKEDGSGTLTLTVKAQHVGNTPFKAHLNGADAVAEGTLQDGSETTITLDLPQKPDAGQLNLTFAAPDGKPQSLDVPFTLETPKSDTDTGTR